ncbi:MAG: hypothetical protein J6X57_04525 [Bacteroidales bacterium]|nr:hypothetical protein [Bacteroidales bacterium]
MAVWALIGFMGCGKSSIGRTVQHLATKAASGVIPVFAKKRLSQKSSGPLQYIDLDEEIVRRCGKSIPEIFSAIGEAGFRAIERDTLEELLTAGGLPAEGRNTRGSIAGGPSATADGGVSEANSRKGKAHLPSDILLSLGGGTLTDEGSRELVKQNCKCIYLRATVETLAANLREAGTEGRPMLAGVNLDAPASAPDSLESHIASMMAERGPIYEKTADIILDIDGLSYEQAARQILSIKSSGS